MRRIAAILIALLVTAVACGSASSPLASVRASASKTTAASTAKIEVVVKSGAGPFAHGVTYSGGFDFRARRGRLQFDLGAFGVRGAGGQIDSVFDFSSGATIYVHLPQLAAAFGGKTWVKYDLGALTATTSGVNINSLLQAQSSDPTSGLRLLNGAQQVTKVGSEVVRGAGTTHYRVVVDVDKAAANASAAARDAATKAANLYIVKTFPVDAWIDGNGRIRRTVVVIDPANLRLPSAAASARRLGAITVTTELFDFGAAVDVAIPPPEDVAPLPQFATPSLGQ